MKYPFHMTLLGVAGWCLLLPAGPVAAQDVFTPPQPYARERYDASWSKNPFALKTAPVVEEKKSFAKDLVLHNAYQAMGAVYVVLGNTKTRELFRLNSTEPAANGMKIRSAMIQDVKKDSYVEVEQNGESAVLRYDEAFRKQMLASNTARPDRKGGADKGNAKDPSAQLTTPNAPQQGQSPTKPESRSAEPGAPRPPLPQRPAPQPNSPSSEPANIRPGGPRTVPPLPRGAPTKVSRRFFTAPPPAPPPATETP